MIADVLLHAGLDMSGAVTFACLLRGCANPSHRHGRVVNWMVRHRWVTQAFSALVVAVITVKAIG